MLGEVQILQGWLNVAKKFKNTYQNSNEFACECGANANVLLMTTMDDSLVRMGYYREMTNRVQMLRKSTGIAIDDQIEVFYRAAR